MSCDSSYWSMCSARTLDSWMGHMAGGLSSEADEERRPGCISGMTCCTFVVFFEVIEQSSLGRVHRQMVSFINVVTASHELDIPCRKSDLMR